MCTCACLYFSCASVFREESAVFLFNVSLSSGELEPWSLSEEKVSGRG